MMPCMKTLLFVLLVEILGTSCVMPGDLREVADSLEDLQTTVADRSATRQDVDKAIENTKERIEEVARTAQARGADFVGRLTDPATLLATLLVSAGSAGAVNVHRDRKRRKRGEPVS